MQIKIAIIDDIYQINSITFDISTLFQLKFFLKCPEEIRVHLIHLGVFICRQIHYFTRNKNDEFRLMVEIFFKYFFSNLKFIVKTDFKNWIN